MDSRIQDAPDDILFKRDHDSVDDFEHLCHDGSPDDRAEQHQQQPRLIDAPRVDDLLHIGDSFRASDSELLPSALIADIETKPVPATPPPSADFDKCESMAQSSDPFQQPLDPLVDPKLASMAFVETERAFPAHQFHDDDDNDEINLQPPLLPTSIATTVKDDDSDDLLFSSTAKIIDEENETESISKAQPIEEREDTTFGFDQGKWHETAPPHSTNIDDDFIPSVKSSVLPTAEKSPVLDFLGDDIVPPREEKTKNLMDDDSWNVVEKTDVKREQAKELEPPMKPLPPLPKEAELLESARQDKYEMSHDFLVAEAVKDKPSPPQRSADSGSAKRHSKPKESDYICPRPVGKKQEIEIAPKEIFKDMGLGKRKNILYFCSLGA